MIGSGNHRCFAVMAALAICSNAIGQSNNPRSAAVALFVIEPHGVTPPVIVHQPGKIVIMVVNRSGRKLSAFRLEDDTSKSNKKDFKFEIGKQDWQEVVTLTQGTYVLTEPGHPELKAKLVIQ